MRLPPGCQALVTNQPGGKKLKYCPGKPMEPINLQEGVLAWGVLYLGMLVGGLLMVGWMSFFLQRKDGGRTRGGKPGPAP
jgi:hypothetical protein